MTKEQVYLVLTEQYGFTPAQIGDMTPYQQYIYATGETGSKTKTFDNPSEYMKWLKQKRKST